MFNQRESESFLLGAFPLHPPKNMKINSEELVILKIDYIRICLIGSLPNLLEKIILIYLL